MRVFRIFLSIITIALVVLGCAKKMSHVTAPRTSNQATGPGGNQPPNVTITSPIPSAIFSPLVPPTIRIHWQGNDPDPVLSPKPVKYKWILLSEGSEFPMDLAIQNPDSLRRYYEPTFAGWDSSGRDSTGTTLTNLVPNSMYLFAIVAFDELGASTQLFSLNSNMLRFRVAHPEALAPELTVFTEFFSYTMRQESEISISVAENSTTTFHWSAVPPVGDNIVGYRWVVDPVDINNETPRSDPSDIHHWTAYSLTETQATLGPFTPAGPTRLYIDILDAYGLETRRAVHFITVPFSPQSDLLIVDDTRLRPDNLNPGTGCTRPPTGRWPTAAELDTFLYARGGVPWRCYSAGNISSAGLFHGYSFDTIGTRGRTNLPLDVLGQYRHVLWIVDQAGALNDRDPFDQIAPTTLLRYMSAPGRVNTLAQYAAAGGEVWLAGGGGGLASMMPWNNRNNDVPTITFSARSLPPELVPGRMMFDLSAWRSEFRVSSEPSPARRFGGRLEGSPLLSSLPPVLERKTPASDPLPPPRTPSDFYPQVAGLEYLQVENDVIEGNESTLDTLFDASGGGLWPPNLNPHNVVMTRYHGPNVPQGFVFSGFDLWSFKRAQLVPLVDFVLHDLWGLNRSVFVTKPHPAPTRDPKGASGGSTIKVGS